MIISSLCNHIQSKFHEDIEELLNSLTIERLIQIQVAIITADTIEEIKKLIKE